MAPAKVPIHPVYAASFEKMKNAPKPRNGDITVQQMRELTNTRMKEIPVAEIVEEDKTVTHNGTEIKLTLFRPIGTENDILPVVVYYVRNLLLFADACFHRYCMLSNDTYMCPGRGVSIVICK